MNWMGPLEPRLKALIVSGDFNDWRAKITSEDYPTSYPFHPAEDEYPWDTLDRFTQLELEAAKWPRGVCIEYGEHDGTTKPQWSRRAWPQVEAFVKAWNAPAGTYVRAHYDGLHEIHGIGTFDYLAYKLHPERAAGRDYTSLVLSDAVESDAGAAGYPVPKPYVTHDLDSTQQRLIRGRFYVSSAAPMFAGLAIRATRVGLPGKIEIRFGTTTGGMKSELPQSPWPRQENKQRLGPSKNTACETRSA